MEGGEREKEGGGRRCWGGDLAEAHVNRDNEALPDGVAASGIHVVVLLVSPFHFRRLPSRPEQGQLKQKTQKNQQGVLVSCHT